MYKKILVAIDIYAVCEQVIGAAANIAKMNDASIEVIAICEPPISYASGHIHSDNAIREELYPKIKALRETFELPEHAIKLIFGGRPADEIISRAEQSECDLIVVGSHGRHGIQLLLGSTANAVLHHAKVDVLAVRVHT